jgi:hypothetical protein
MSICSEMKEGVIFTRYVNEIDAEMGNQHLSSIENLCGKIRVYNEFVDFSACMSIKLTKDEVIKLGFRYAGLFEKFESSFMAMYVPSDFHYGMGMMLQACATSFDNPGVVRIIRDKERAPAWVKRCIRISKTLCSNQEEQ